MAKDAGVDGILVSGFSTNQLLALVEKLLSRRE